VKKLFLVAVLLALAASAQAYDWQFEQVDTVGNWSSPSLNMSGTGVLHFCYRAPGNRVVHSYLDSIWHHEEVGPFDTLVAYAADVGAHGDFGLVLNLSGGNIWLYEKHDTTWQPDSIPVPANASSPRFSYDPVGAPSIVFQLGDTMKYARRTESTWVSETMAVTPSWYWYLPPAALMYTVNGEPCAMISAYYPEFNSYFVFLRIEQADTWRQYYVAGGGRRSAFSAVCCAPDTGGGAAVLFDYRDEFGSTEFDYYGFGTGNWRLDTTWASAGAVAIHSSGTPHVTYIVSELSYACRVGATWYYDTVSTAPNLQLAGIVLEDSSPIIGFTDPATGVWIARRQPVGIQEQSYCSHQWPHPTIVGGVLRVPEAGGHGAPVRSILYDLNGRAVARLHSGANDVRALAPGVYFVRGESQASSAKPQAVRKVVLTGRR
jgi:hypothetical protein